MGFGRSEYKTASHPLCVSIYIIYHVVLLLGYREEYKNFREVKDFWGGGSCIESRKEEWTGTMAVRRLLE